MNGATYQPQPGTTAFRVLGFLESLPVGSEVMTSAIAASLGIPHKNITPCLDAAVSSGRLFKRQRDDHVRSPYWWSLTDKSGGAPPPKRVLVSVPSDNEESSLTSLPTMIGEPLRGQAWHPWKTAHENTPKGPNRDATGFEGRAPQGADATDCEARGKVMAPRGSASPNGRGGDAPPACGAGPAFLPRTAGPSHVLKAEAATPDATRDSGPATASPRVGAMGVGQAADAAPAGEDQRSGGVESRHSASGLRPVLDGDASREMPRRTTLRGRADITEEAPHRSPEWPGIAGVAPGPLHPTFRNAKAPDEGRHEGDEAAQRPHDDSPGPDAASTPTNGRHPARRGSTGPRGPGSSGQLRIALWSDGTLQIERPYAVGGAAALMLLCRDETRQLVRYLDRLGEGV